MTKEYSALRNRGELQGNNKLTDEKKKTTSSESTVNQRKLR